MDFHKEKYMIFFNTVTSIFLSNWKFLLSFILLHTAIGQLIIFSFLKDLIDFSVNQAGYEFLNTTVLLKWLTNPFTIPVIIICILTLSFYVMFEMSTFILYVDYMRKNMKVSWKKCLTKSIKRSARILLPKNWILLILILLVFPLTFLSFNFSLIFRLHIPEFIVDFIQANTVLSILYFAIIIFFNILAFILIFTIPAFILDLQSFKDAISTSLNLIKKHLKYIISRYIMGMISILILSGFIFAVSIGLILLIVKYSHNSSNAASTFIEYYISFKMFSSFFFDIVIVIFNFLFIAVIYIKMSNQQFTQITRKKISIRGIILTIISFLIAIIPIGIYIDYSKGLPAYYNRVNELNEIVAHRAGAIFAPENTLIALEKAIQDGASNAEIDVQQTKDGKLVILHDTNLKRVAGVSKNVWDLSYNEIKDLDIGSHFSYEYKDARIPTLSQMIEKADGNINLMIEIKKTSHDKDIERQVVNEIKKYNFENQCSIASMDLDTLKMVKDIAPEITTVYITPAIYGNYYSLEYIDAFSIEYSFVNKETVTLTHKYNKKIYVWTVNRENNLSKILNLNVDGIITDNPVFAKYLKNLGSRDLLVESLLNYFF